MKKAIFKTILTSILIALLAVGCKKNGNGVGGPTLAFVIDSGYLSLDTAIAVGDTSMIGLNCVWNGSDLIKTVNTYLNDNLNGEPYLVEAAMGQNLTFNKKITKSLNPKEIWEFEVIDAGGNTSRLKLTISNDYSGGNIKTINAIIGAQNNSGIGSYYNLANNISFFKAQADTSQKFIDLLGGYDFFTKSFISSPGSDSLFGVYDFNLWETTNLTQFCTTTISKAQFELTNRDNLLISSFHADQAKNHIKELKSNNVYSFKTQNGKFGLMLILYGALSETDIITFDLKMQQ